MKTSDIDIFSKDLLQDVVASAESGEDGEFRVNEFTRIAAEFLIDAGEIDGLDLCYHKSRGILLNGYNVSESGDCIDLFVSIFTQTSPPLPVSKTQCNAAFRQAEKCLLKGFDGFYRSLEEASEVYDAFQHIYTLRKNISKCRIYLVTDGRVERNEARREVIEGIEFSYNIWDIQRLFQFATSGQKLESIEIDFHERFGSGIECLRLSDSASDYQGYLAVVPGLVLSEIYNDFGPRLLERNVRAFLQARGKVNKGIRNTIIQEPHRFFAYNNGITATADHIEFEEESDTLKIRKVKNFQIVNGGQTTASLHHTKLRDKADLSGIFVQAKISVIPESQIDHVVPLISKYANSQNKVSDADFYANDPFHVQIEELSRTVWTPAIGGNTRATRWFYERSRGQYADAKARELTPARRRKFEALHPSRQKFTKTDLAKFENTWMQLPHLVSLGAQKNFNEFSIRLKERGSAKVDVRYFERLIAKAVLFKQADKIVREQGFGGYKANIVTYTLAWLSHKSSQRIDLDRIWRDQDIVPSLREAIRLVSHEVYASITKPPGSKNVTEWCKRKDCWNQIRGLDIALPSGLIKAFLSGEERANPDRGIYEPNSDESGLIETIQSTEPQMWYEIARWAKETDNLQPWQRSLAFSIGNLLGRSAVVSRKQAKQGAIILEESKRLGFKQPAKT